MPAKIRPRQVFLGPLDYCQTPAQKKKLLKQLSGEVKTYKMTDKIENIKSYEEIKAMPFDKARQYLIDIKSKHSVNAIAARWDQLSSSENFYNAKMYKVFHDFNVPVRSERMAKAHEIRSQMAEAGQLRHNLQNNPVGTVPVPEPKEPFKQYKAVEVTPTPNKVKKTSFTINLDGEFAGKELAEKMESICKLLVSGKNYNVIFSVEEAGE